MDTILSLLSTYKYLILFPLAIFEGPVTTLTAGFLSSIGVFNIFLAYIIIVCGDIVGDAIFYLIGRFSSTLIDKHGHKIGITEKRITISRNYFNNNRKKALVFSKILHGVGFTGLIVAGSLKIPYRKFFPVCFTVTLLQTLLLITIGSILGKAYTLIGPYLSYYDSITLFVITIILIIIFVKKFNILKS
jgi:membrane protein DedA with SNARE-associated domain